MTKASQKARPKHVEKWDESKCKNEMKASGKLDEASQPRPAKKQAMSKTSEVQRPRLLKDVLVNKDQQKSTEVHKSTEPRRQSTTNFRLSRRRSNELQKWGWLCHTMRPTDKPHAHRDAIYWVAPGSRPRSLLRSRPARSTMSTKIRLKPPIESPTRSRPWSLPCRSRLYSSLYLRAQPWSQPDGHWSRLPKTTTLSTSIWESMTLPAARDILQSMRKHCMKAQESAGTLKLGKYNHFRDAHSLDLDSCDATT